MTKTKLTANILFSGIGCQERGFENSGLFDIEVINTSDINKESVLSYAAIHCGMTNEMVESYKDYPLREEMAQYLMDINLGYEPEKDKYFDWFKLAKKKTNDLEKYYLACKLSNNKGDIRRIEELPYADFWTVSFPCTDISIAGKMKGLNAGSGTRSSLLWENIRLLKKAKDNDTLPKYIMIENVKNLVGKKFINHFNDLLGVLDELGFNSYWAVMNGKDCGVPQNRERVFVVSIRKDIDNGLFVFPKPFDTGTRLKDVLEEVVDEKYYLSDFAIRNFKKFEEIKGKNVNGGGYCSNSESAVIKQIGQIYGLGKEPNPQAGRVYDKEFLSPTLDTCSGGNRMPKILEKSNDATEDIRIRKLTPRECFRLMGLTFEDCDKAKDIGVANTHLYKQAGNGIITNCCELLAEHLFKTQYDNTYVCTDDMKIIKS